MRRGRAGLLREAQDLRVRRLLELPHRRQFELDLKDVGGLPHSPLAGPPYRSQEISMHERTFDSLSRRASLTALGAAGLIGLLAHAPTTEGKASTSQKAKQKCKKQV